ncbi:hypothetical protein AAFX24_08060 [Vibrio mediterranei]|uniref:hypothetical protein n=1 Tax=Vibrio mediterranei TaxID=689 RepID=UPI0038CE382E
MYKYYPALRVKWCTLNWLSGLTIGAILSFYTPLFSSDLYSNPSKLGFAFVFSLVYTALFYEWSFVNENRGLGKAHSKIFEYSYHRTKYLGHTEALKEAWITLTLIVISLSFVLLAWLNPALSTLSNWLVGLCAATLGGYSTSEEFAAPEGKKQRVVFAISVSTFSLLMILFLFMSFKGVSYSESNTGLPVFILTATSWFSFGLLGAVLSKVSRNGWD